MRLVQSDPPRSKNASRTIDYLDYRRKSCSIMSFTTWTSRILQPKINAQKQCFSTLQRFDVFFCLHDDSTAGHLVTVKTITWIARFYYTGPECLGILPNMFTIARTARSTRRPNSIPQVSYARHTFQLYGNKSRSI